MDVWVTDNSSTKRRGQYIAYTVTRAADGPDGMEARGRHSTGGGKGLINHFYTYNRSRKSDAPRTLGRWDAAL